MKLKIKKIHESAVVPKYSYEGDAGFDLSSVGEHLLSPSKKILVKTGLQMEIPTGFFGSIRDRSGLAYKNGIHVLAGVVDSGYRGEVGVILVNHGEEDFKINVGDRIAQMIIQSHETPEIEEAKNTSETSRGEGGFGSTGVN